MIMDVVAEAQLQEWLKPLLDELQSKFGARVKSEHLSQEELNEFLSAYKVGSLGQNLLSLTTFKEILERFMERDATEAAFCIHEKNALPNTPGGVLVVRDGTDV